ncbi:ABC transporter substrate-binding protein [Saccharomonospora sp. NPDC046836]|uniref:ABC transporter substrate-binding protein n=1 Tax=Saccharomonospora sp. NPDC046836 TaxID=3156921 RepID=UPI0033E18BD2
MSDTPRRQRWLRHGGLAVVVVVMTAAAAGCGTSASSTADVLPLPRISTLDGLVIDGEKIADKTVYDAAAGGSVSLYTTASQQAEDFVSERFTEETGISLTFTRLATSKMSERIQSEAGSGRLGADVIRLTDPVFAAKLGEQGVLVPYDPPSKADLLASDAMRPGDPVITCYYAAYAFAYNNRVVQPQDAPSRWEDLLDRRFSGGLLGVVRPFGSGASLADFGLRNFGEQYWREMAALQPRVFDSVSVQTEALARGEIAVATFPAHAAYAAERAGAPITFVTPEDVGVSAPLNVIGMTEAGLRNPAAQVFVNWTMAKSSQRFFAAQGYIPARAGVTPVRDGQFDLPTVGSPELQIFSLEDQRARKDEVLETWNAAFGFTASK